MKALLVTGGAGLLGAELARRRSAGDLYRSCRSGELDITRPAAAAARVGAFAADARARGLPAVLINAAAFTDADAAEARPERAFAVNALGPAHLAAACHRHDVAMVHVSSDYVFDGRTGRPYEPLDAPNPLSVYGRTKLAGEWAVTGSGARAWVVRTAWVYGTHNRNFLSTMVRLERDRPWVSVVTDQIGSPTWAGDLAAGLLALADLITADAAPAERLLHCVNPGAASWHRLACEIFRRLGADPDRVRPCTTAEFGRPAPRPGYSVLGLDSWREAGLPVPRPWLAALDAAFESSALGDDLFAHLPIEVAPFGRERIAARR
ncbi:dTDP-4-dehydrorhamnose reductase [Dactylosporangium vinaceum]|uniref:dTDP-4-dehydrorhamnose reductase n=1 Tax=Dactylosporangium vinaceum TaxID=53362 RepID=A0ABV5M3A9_9ACTN|nr:dTDP-4-dehydrorhamnose reductase [Dactylosporangium vinaceum]UAB99740.1 dTDP-4-dehydrorhamnose reductase [Dactylosporangium vinaceum]